MAADPRTIGLVGESLFQTYLERQGWMVLDTSKDDRGTDFVAYVDVSGKREMAPIAFQVKTHESVSVSVTRGGDHGHTFRESGDEAAKHLDYWLKNDTPHFLIVQSVDEKTRLWQRLDHAHLKRTKKGLKVFVPSSNVVEVVPPGAWLDTARERAAKRYQSLSRWQVGIAPPVTPEQELRVALTTPRLVAVHPNHANAHFGPAQAVADSVIGGGAWDRRTGGGDGTPSVESAHSHADERWRFAAALHDAVFGISEAGIAELAESALDAAVRAAARVVTTARLVEDARPHEAIALASADADFTPEDRHWILCHRATALACVGDLQSAAALATEALTQSLSLGAELAMQSLNANLMWLRYRNNGEPEHVADMLHTSDNAARWWRDQHVASAMRPTARALFDSWSSTPTVRFGAADQGHNELFAAEFQARMLTSLDEARNIASVMARTDLMIHGDEPPRVRKSLYTLVLSGDDESVRAALTRVVRAHPPQVLDGLDAIAVRALDDIRLAKAGVEALRRLGPHIADDSKGRAIDALLQLLQRADALANAGLVSSTLDTSVLNALRAIGGVLTAAETEAVVGWVLGRSTADSFHEEASEAAARLLDERGMPVSGHTRQRVLGALRRLDHTSAKYWALVASLGRTSRAATSRIEEGKDSGVRHVGLLASRVGDFNESQMRERLAAHLAYLEHDMSSALQSGYSFPGPDAPRAAALFALEVGDTAALEVVARYIGSPNVQSHVKREPLLVLTRAVNTSLEFDHATLRASALAAREQAAATPSGGRLVDTIGGAAEVLLLALETSKSSLAEMLVGHLLQGDETQRRDLCDALAFRADFDIALVALARDPAYTVRIRAAQAIAHSLALRGGESELLAPVLAAAIRDGGVETLAQVERMLRALSETGKARPEAAEIVLETAMGRTRKSEQLRNGAGA